MSHPLKTCKGCGESKPESEYYLCGKANKTPMGKCKICVRADSKANTERLMRDAVWVEKELERQRIKQRKKNGTITIPREKRNQYVRRYKESHPERRAAHVLVGNAIRSGKIVQKPCEVCGDPNSQGHHEDYSKPLDVIWYCPKHHAERHVEIRRIQRMMKNNPPHSPLA